MPGPWSDMPPEARERMRLRDERGRQRRESRQQAKNVAAEVAREAALGAVRGAAAGAAAAYEHAGFPRLPWQHDRPQPRQRSNMSRARIAEVTLAIIDAEGTDAVSMRRVAAEFDTGAASLYAYVTGKDDMLALAHELALDELDLAAIGGAGESWQDVVRSWAFATQSMYSRHQDLARLSFGDLPSSPKIMDVIEVLMSTMIAGGVPGGLSGKLIDRLTLYIGADVFEGWLLSHRFAGHGRGTEQENAQAWYAAIGDFFRKLPRDRYPTITDHVEDLMDGDGQERFELGLEMMIAGTAELARQQMVSAPESGSEPDTEPASEPVGAVEPEPETVAEPGGEVDR